MPVNGPITVTMEFELDNGNCDKALNVIVPDNDSSVTSTCNEGTCNEGKLSVEIKLRNVSSLFSVPNEILTQVQIFEEMEKKL